MTEILYCDVNGKYLPVKCPFGKRDLSHDECYSGNGVHKCQYFIRYKHYLSGDYLSDGRKVVACASSILCSCNEKPFDYLQLSLF